MKTLLGPAVVRLETRLPAALRSGLAIDPHGALSEMGLTVVEMSRVATSEACSVDGAYFSETYGPKPAIGYVRTPGSRRENFTLLHELAHHLVRLDDALLSSLADEGDDRDTIEERICDAFAGRLLIPEEVVKGVLGGRRPEAKDVRRLFNACLGSREACAVRLAERIRCEGYVALLDRGSNTVRFASTSPETSHAWGRGSPLPSGHPAWRAGGTETFRGEGEVVWRSGYRRNLWLDAIEDGPVVVAVFAADRYWPASGLGILSDPSQTRATPILFTGTCRHCGASVWGTRTCDKCGDVTCRSCGRCGCGAATPLVKVCTQCHMKKGKAQFPAGSSVCRDCQPP
jgi:hypothetical protein